jgi:hypothetical protein
MPRVKKETQEINKAIKNGIMHLAPLPTTTTPTPTYRPTDTLRRLKASFWADARDIVVEDSEVTPALIRQVLSPDEASHVLSVIEANPAAYRWFAHSRETQARVEYLFLKALDALEQVIDNPDPRNGMSRVTAARQLGELAGKFQRKKDEADNSLERLKVQLGKMSKEQLEQYLGSNSSLLRSAMKQDTMEEKEHDNEKQRLDPPSDS